MYFCYRILFFFSFVTTFINPTFDSGKIYFSSFCALLFLLLYMVPCFVTLYILCAFQEKLLAKFFLAEVGNLGALIFRTCWSLLFWKSDFYKTSQIWLPKITSCSWNCRTVFSIFFFALWDLSLLLSIHRTSESYTLQNFPHHFLSCSDLVNVSPLWLRFYYSTYLPKSVTYYL